MPALRVWLTDESADRSATMASLDKGLRRLDAAARFCRRPFAATEKVSEADDKMLEKYLGGEEPTVDEIKAALRKRFGDLGVVIRTIRGFGYVMEAVDGPASAATQPAAFAALLHDSVKAVTLKNALTSYLELAQTEDYQWPFAIMLPNVLAHFDLPEVHAALQSKNLQTSAPWGPLDGMKD